MEGTFSLSRLLSERSSLFSYLLRRTLFAAVNDLAEVMFGGSYRILRVSAPHKHILSNSSIWESKIFVLYFNYISGIMAVYRLWIGVF